MTVAVPRTSTRSLPDFLRLLASHADATYVDGTTLVKEWGISNSTLEVRRAGAVVAGGVDAVGGCDAVVVVPWC